MYNMMKVLVQVLFLAVAVYPSCLCIDVVPKLNTTHYLGRWYQMYSDQIVISTFERNGVCVCADYTLRKDGKIGVLNSQRIKTPTGELKQITGYAYTPDPKVPGKLKVHFDVAPIDGSYWIVKLGPLTYGPEKQYQYSIVTDGLQLTMFVLARDPEGFTKEYDAEVKTFLKNNGFTHFYNKPIATMQSKECEYPKPPVSIYQTAEGYLNQS